MRNVSDIVRYARTLTINTRRSLHGRSIGPYPKAWSGGGFEFRQLRGYTPGDDIRFVDWKSSARTGELLVRDYYDEQNRTFVIVLDCSASMQFSSVRDRKADVAGDIAASIAYAMYLHGDAVGYIAVSGDQLYSLPPRVGHQHVRSVIEQIAHDIKVPHGRISMSEVARRLMYMYPRPTGVVYISDFLDDGYEKAMKKMAYQHAYMPIRILDPQEVQLNVPHETEIYDTETGDQIMMTHGMHEAYQQWFSYYDAYFYNAIRRAGARSCTCYTHSDWISQVRTFMYKA